MLTIKVTCGHLTHLHTHCYKTFTGMMDGALHMCVKMTTCTRRTTDGLISWVPTVLDQGCFSRANAHLDVVPCMCVCVWGSSQWQ